MTDLVGGPSDKGPEELGPLAIEQGLELMRLFFDLKTVEDRTFVLSRLRSFVARSQK